MRTKGYKRVIILVVCFFLISVLPQPAFADQFSNPLPQYVPSQDGYRVDSKFLGPAAFTTMEIGGGGGVGIAIALIPGAPPVAAALVGTITTCLATYNPARYDHYFYETEYERQRLITENAWDFWNGSYQKTYYVTEVRFATLYKVTDKYSRSGQTVKYEHNPGAWLDKEGLFYIIGQMGGRGE